MRISAVQILGQAAMYAVFMAVIGYFATSPAYTFVDPGAAVITLSFTHAGERKSECRRLTPEELAALAPNMRRPTDCPRGRVSLLVELDLDDETLYRASLPPSGLAGDGASAAYERFVVAPGRYRLRARLRDSRREEGFDYVLEKDVELVPGQHLVVDFRAGTGGFKLL
ncbi:MAG: hypothetical protein BMS9Abin14_877 [Gammaproteobacteria bacterium]|nr:MAG: hypothetical protein BMS9Abin14_877 [Gammaproteobacteria bacterium]